MKNSILISIAVLFLLFPAAYFGQSTELQVFPLPKGCVIQEGNVLERKDCGIVWENKEFSWAVGDIFMQTDVPSGISVAFENAGGEEIIIDSNPTDFIVKNLLDEIIKFDTRYRWKETDGVINVFPRDEHPILDVRIAKFKVEKAEARELREKLVQTKEFQKYLKAENLVDKVPDPENKYGSLFIGAAGKSSERHKITLDLKNATVREILNAIVRQRGYSTWLYSEYDVISEGKTYHIYRLEM